MSLEALTDVFFAPPPSPCVSGSCLNTKNQLECTWIEECTSSTETCKVCYTTLTDTAAKVGLVRYEDTHLYRFALCDGQTPFKIYLTTNLGNADMYVWNQPDLSLLPNVTSTDPLQFTATLEIRANLGIRYYTVGVVGRALFGSSYKVWVETQAVPLTRGIAYSHSVNANCSQYYYWENEYPKGDFTPTTQGGAGHAFQAPVPDQVLTNVEVAGIVTSSSAPFHIYSFFNQLKRPEIVLPQMPTNNTGGLAGTALPGRAIGYTVNGQRRLYGYPTKNEYTMQSGSDSWKFGRYYTSIQLAQVLPPLLRLSAFLPAICLHARYMNHSKHFC